MTDDACSLARDGLAAAMERLGDHLDRNANPFAPLSEVLHWLYCLEESVSDDVGRKRYFALRSQSDDGRALGALIYARNRMTHQLAITSEDRNTYPGEETFPGERTFPGGGWWWLPFDELPESSQPSEGDEERQAWYRQHVDGRDIAQPIGAAIRFVDRHT